MSYKRREREKVDYQDFSNAEVQREYAVPEELPDGPYGSAINKHTKVENKDAVKGQRHYTPFNYENKHLHEDLPRQFPNAHPTHDEED
ncbi:hypothetical protein SAMN05421676_10173 [Salinibacillus kushneri]|uniref:Cytosolic protein n=1 Tax=Salinibacillus kushneri TaxID=237682 RepID=A0A1H9Y8U2_9BACI|nr:hypothetical protein [Salinibacillus kushneri]SES65363.1 hypothetical protein SAMN05421676_10173 [Salinibacillus kushneri]